MELCRNVHLCWIWICVLWQIKLCDPIPLTHSSVFSCYDINRRSGLTRSAMQKSDNCIWKSRLSLGTKLKLYNTCILPIMLYGSECWALPKANARKIDVLDQWCLRRILDIRWYHRISNREVRRMTEQPPLTDIIQKRRLMLFGHVARMEETADARRILTGVHQSNWSRPVGRPYTSWMATVKSDLSLHNLTFEDAIELALDKSLWRLLVASGATHWHGACRIMMMMMILVVTRYYLETWIVK